MAQKFQPKSINFLPASVRRKFIVPSNPREMGTLVILIGLAVIIVAAWTNLSDVVIRVDKRTATGAFVASAPFRSGNAQRMVGVYIFTDEAKLPVGVRGERVFTRKANIPRKAEVVWPPGRPHKARVVGEHYNHLIAVPVGIAILGFGIWMRRKRVDPYVLAMTGSEVPETTKAQ